MRLRSISLTNVRRFAGTTARLDGLGDGLNLVAAPNEAGKWASALCRRRARGRGRGRGRWRRLRIVKRWLQRPFARVAELPSGRVIAQDDEAEAWIAARIAADGPAGLLWVRQGELALEPEGSAPADKAERDRRARIRRDLLLGRARD